MTKEELLQTYFYIEDISGSANTVYVTKYESSAPSITLYYSYDCTTWYSFTFSTTSFAISLPANSRVYLKGNNGYFSTNKYNYINCANNFKAGGNIMSLISGDNFKTTQTITNSYALAGVFYHSTRLIDASELILPATNLSSNCYQSFFGYCSNLTTPPKILDCTTLSSECYRYMFGACSSLTTAPELPATELVNGCYYQMFYNCSKLNYIKADFINYNSNNTYNWVSGVSSTGTFIKNPEATYNPENIRGVDGIPTGWNIENGIIEIPDYFYIEDISGSTNTVTIQKNSSSAPTLNLEYSTDGSTWTTVTMNSGTTANTFTIPANGKLYLRGVNNGWCGSGSQDNYNKITSSGNHNVGGNIMSLLYGKNFQGKTSFPTTNAFALCNLFYQNTTLVNAQDLQLPATTLAVRCYRYMFNGCTSLTTAPSILPATTLAGYCCTFMFYNCTSLTTAPELPATNLAEYCYASMFKGCTSLTTAPSILPATTLMEGCYDNMFYNCSSLTITPELPATTLGKYCYYYMFANCTSLTTAPELPATNLANYCYNYMFYGCSSLTTAPAILPATTLTESCYLNMFNGCSSLTSAPELPSTTLTDSCYGSMFQSCTSLTSAPELPATTLANNCYSYMFYGCTSLTTAPALPATTLATNCYNYMFSSCSKLNYVCALFTDTPNTNSSTSNWLKGVSETGTFIKNANATWDTESYRGISGIPIGWNVYASNQREITISSNNTNYGTVSGSTSGIYNLGDTITFTATPAEKCVFIKWSDGSTELTRTIEITENTPYVNEYTAIFKLPSNIYFINESENTNILKIIKSNKNLQYKIGNEDWVEITEKVKTIEFEDIVYIKGNNTTLNGVKFNNSEYTSVGGKLSALLYGEDVDFMGNIIPEGSTNTFKGLFKNNTNLVDISGLVLPENTTKGCYSYMFQGCTNLGINYTSTDNTILILPATELAVNCYQHMFTGCKSLKSIPELPANDLTRKCYHGMFMNCDGIDKVSLPEAYLAPYAYSNIFLGSDNLSDVTVTYKDDVDETNYKGWLNSVSVNGKFTYNHTEEVEEKLIRSNYYVPDTWDVTKN